MANFGQAMAEIGQAVREKISNETPSSDEATKETPPAVESTSEETSQVEGGEPTTQEEAVAETAEESPPEKDKGKMRKVKADGEIHEIPEDRIDEYLSKAIHWDQKNAKANKAIRDNQLLASQWQSFLSDPEKVFEYAVQNGIDVSKFVKTPKEEGVVKDYEVDEYDDPETAELKKQLNAYSSRLKSIESQVSRQRDEVDTKNLAMEYENKRKQWGLPENASPAVFALLRMGENQYAGTNQMYTLDSAIRDYVNSIPPIDVLLNGLEPNAEMIDAIKKNSKLAEALKKEFISEYNEAEVERSKKNRVPASTSKVEVAPLPKDKKFKSIGELLNAMRPGAHGRLARKK